MKKHFRQKKNKKVQKDFNIDSQVDRYFLERENTIISKIGQYHVSQLAHCLRRYYYDLIDPLETSGGNRVMESGRYGHKFLQDVLKKTLKARVEVPKKIELDGGIVVLGNVDVVLPDCILEIKTVKALYDRPDFEVIYPHQLQANSYMGMCKKRFGYVVYLSRSDFRTKQVRIPYDHELFKELSKRAYKLDECLKAEEVPASEGKIMVRFRTDCMFCPYTDACKLSSDSF